MGLAGRKTKQRIGVDPRNTSWADDASRFGKSYLEKFGWSSGTGLGANGDGMTSHLKVMHKLDLMGIGANRLREGDEGGQGRDYEQLLRRLNESVATPLTPPEDSGATTPTEPEVEKEGPPKKKRKQESKPEEEPQPTKQIHVPRPMAHRSKFLKSKNMAKTSQTALNEILGISPSASSSTTPKPGTPAPVIVSTSEVGSGAQTPNRDSQAQPNDLDLLSTSTKTVADYFAEKLAARKKAVQATSSAAPARLPLAATPCESTDLQQHPQVQDCPESHADEPKKRKKEKKDRKEKVHHDSLAPAEDSDKNKNKKSKKKDKEGPAVSSTSVAVGEVVEDDVGEKKKKKKKRKAEDETC